MSEPIGEPADGTLPPGGDGSCVKIEANGSSSKTTESLVVTETNDVQKPQESQVKKPAGYAQIKSEFLVTDHKPTIQSEYLSNDMKEKLATEKEKQNNNEEEPPAKKIKLTGRNKNRPRMERVDEKDRLCPNFKEGRFCKFGERCKFSHDMKSFLEKKRPDIGDKCPVYEKWGYCKFGVTCRLASGHLDANNENVTNKELYDAMKDTPRCLNVLKEEVKNSLWKKKYNFDQSEKIVKSIQIKNNGPENSSSLQVVTGSVSDGNEFGDVNITNSQESNAPIVDNAPVPDPVPLSAGGILDDVPIRPTSREIKKIDFREKLYLAPLTTVGNLPFRRVCKTYGADVTCGEMALAPQLLKAKAPEWSLIRRHPSEDLFGVQVCGAHPDYMARCAQMLTETTDIDFIDINCGCPIDLVFKKGSGSALMGKVTKLEQICQSMIGVMGDIPLTVKLRTGVYDNKNVAHNIIPRLRDAGVSLVTIHGRSREQRYTKLADWNYIDQCAKLADPMPVFGNGDILSYEDANLHMERTGVSGVMIARGALIKPWIFTEIKEQRHWDISSSERFDILRSFSNYGLEYWGSDDQGVEKTRRFLLEWLSFLHRYIPVGVLEQVPQKINERPPYYIGRNDLETLMASTNCADWIKISEMLLGPVPSSFQFLPKHKANAYQ